MPMPSIASTAGPGCSPGAKVTLRARFVVRITMGRRLGDQSRKSFLSGLVAPGSVRLPQPREVFAVSLPPRVGDRSGPISRLACLLHIPPSMPSKECWRSADPTASRSRMIPMTFKHLLAASFVVFAAIQTAEANGFSAGASRSQLSRPVYHSATQQAAAEQSEPVTVTVRCGVVDGTQGSAAGVNCRCCNDCRQCPSCGGCQCDCDNCDCAPCVCEKNCNCGPGQCNCPRTASRCRCANRARTIPQSQVAYVSYVQR